MGNTWRRDDVRNAQFGIYFPIPNFVLDLVIKMMFGKSALKMYNSLKLDNQSEKDLKPKMVDTNNIGINFGALNHQGFSPISIKSLAFKD